MDLINAVGRMTRELLRARAKHPAFQSAHEGWAVITERVDKLDESSEPADIMHRTAQVAAMAFRFIHTLTELSEAEVLIQVLSSFEHPRKGCARVRDGVEAVAIFRRLLDVVWADVREDDSLSACKTASEICAVAMRFLMTFKADG